MKGKSTGNHRFSHEIWGFPVIFALNQSIDCVAQTHSMYRFETPQKTAEPNYDQSIGPRVLETRAQGMESDLTENLAIQDKHRI